MRCEIITFAARGMMAVNGIICHRRVGLVTAPPVGNRRCWVEDSDWKRLIYQLKR